MKHPIRTAEALTEQDEAFSRAPIRPAEFDWPLVLEEARNIVAFAFVAFVTVYAVLSL